MLQMRWALADSVSCGRAVKLHLRADTVARQTNEETVEKGSCRRHGSRDTVVGGFLGGFLKSVRLRSGKITEVYGGLQLLDGAQVEMLLLRRGSNGYQNGKLASPGSWQLEIFY